MILFKINLYCIALIPFKKLSQTFMFKITNHVPYCIILCYTVNLLLLVKYMSYMIFVNRVDWVHTKTLNLLRKRGL